jgi:hypothetical protein
VSDLPNRPANTPPGPAPNAEPAGSTDVDQPPRVVEVDASDDPPSGTKEVAQQEASEVAQDARDQAKEVAASARGGAAEVVEEAKHHASDLVDDARAQLHGQARQQTDQLGRTIQGLGEKLHAVADGRPDEAGQVTDYTERLADQVEQLGSRVTELGFDGTIEELQRFARRRPGMFLLGATAAGFVAARLGRGAKDAQDSPNEGPQQRTASGNGTERSTPRHDASPVQPDPRPAVSTADTSVPGERP